jgi:hypothetical protein
MSSFSKVILIFFLVLSPILVYSQQYDNLFKSKINLNNLKEEHRLVISTKMGYHTGYNLSKDNGFNGGLIFGINAEVGLTETFFAGFSFEFWHHESGELTNYWGKYSTTYSANNFSVNLYKKFINDKYSINLGIGLGKYNINKTVGQNDGYFALKLIAGYDYRISDLFWISAEANYNNMFNMEKGADFFSLKVGPTIMLSDL